MELIKVVPRGYCKGVVRAINIAKETALNNPDQNIYILGMLSFDLLWITSSVSVLFRGCW